MKTNLISHLCALCAWVCFALSSPLSSRAANPSASTPDFAFPAKVTASSRANLASALKADNPEAVMRALLNLSVAQQLVSPDSLPPLLDQTRQVNRTTHSPALKALTSLLEARLLNGLYTSQPWVYDSRTAPTEGAPAQWSGAQFRARISALLSSALTPRTQLYAIPLRSWQTVITQTPDSRQLYPTLYDFIASQSLKILEGWSTVPHAFPLARILDSTPATPFRTPADPVANQILDIYSSLISLHGRNSAPGVEAELSRARFLALRAVADNGVVGQDITPILWRLYQSYLVNGKISPLSSPYAPRILLAIGVPSAYPLRREVYSAVTLSLAAYPDGPDTEALKHLSDQLTQPLVKLLTPAVVPPASPVSAKVEIENARSLALRIYNISAVEKLTAFNVSPKSLAPYKLVSEKIVPLGSPDLPYSSTLSANLTFPSEGLYIVVPVVNGSILPRSSYGVVRATRIGLSSASFDSQSVWAVDPLDGTPLRGVSISALINPYSKSPKAKSLGATDKNGILTLSNIEGMITATRGSDRYAAPLYVNPPYKSDSKWTLATTGWTSLPLFHPGDSVQWAMVLYEFKGDTKRPCTNLRKTVRLYDPTYNLIDSLVVTSDSFGRVSGTFQLPSSSLSGNFSLQIPDAQGGLDFNVSDYKLPSYKVEIQGVDQNTPHRGDASLHGRSLRFDGTPVQSSEVRLSLSVSPVGSRFYWRPSRRFEVWNTQVSANHDGTFSVLIPDSIFSSSPLPNGIYTASVQAVAPSGESQSAEFQFTRSARLSVVANIPDVADLSLPSGSLKFSASLRDWRDSLIADAPIAYRLLHADSLCLSGQVSPPSATIPTKSLSAGRYRLQLFSPKADSDTLTQDVTLYRPVVGAPTPSDQLLWSPVEKLTATTPDSLRLWVGVNHDAHILMTLVADGKILLQEWRPVSRGMNLLALPPRAISKDFTRGSLTLGAFGGYEMQTLTLPVELTSRIPSLTIIPEAFRDSLSPGSRESFRFRLVDATGRGVRAAFVADIVNSALSSLSPIRFSSNFSEGWTPTFSLGGSRLGSLVDFYGVLPVKSKGIASNFAAPEFETYGYPLTPALRRSRNLMLRSDAKMMMSANSDMGLPANGAMLEEAAETLSVESAKTSGSDTSLSSSPSIRQGETLLGLFNPLITSDKDGLFTLDFPVPDQSGSWEFNGIAFTDRLVSTPFKASMNALKHLAVRPTLPRYLTAGDSTIIPVTVTNSADFKDVIGSYIAINPLPDRYGSKYDDIFYLPAHSSVVLTTPCAIPPQTDLVEFTVTAYGAGCSDSQRDLIPVLPASQRAISSQPFVLPADTKELSLQLNALPAGADAWFEYCDNPLWYVATALPAIADRNGSSTSIETVRSLFALCVARKIVTDNPSVAAQFAKWLRDNANSSEFTSMLERNPELKTILIQSTPWQDDARSESQRISQLAQLFNLKFLNSQITAKLADLAKFHIGPDGWSWLPDEPKASTHFTQEVLHTLGWLSTLGALPADRELESHIRAALDSEQQRVISSLATHPDRNFTSCLFTRSLFGKRFGAPDPRLVESQIHRHILPSWRRMDILSKARAAAILSANGYTSVAREVVASIAEFAETLPDGSVWFPSVMSGSLESVGTQAEIALLLRAVTPDRSLSHILNGLSQWLIMEKTRTGWREARSAVLSVAAVFAISPEWVSRGDLPSLTLNGHTLPLGNPASWTGSITLPLQTPVAQGTELTIRRNSSTPAWGAVISAAAQPTTEIKASSIPSLSVTKRIVDTSGKDLTTPRVGDKVTTILTVTVTKDMDYVLLSDRRAACLEPLRQLAGYDSEANISYYTENRGADTRFFITHLPRGVHQITYSEYVTLAGRYVSGPAEVQSQYAERYAAHSSGSWLTVLPSLLAPPTKLERPPSHSNCN